MTLAFAGLSPLFVGPVGVLLLTGLVIALLLVITRVVFGLAIKVIVVGAVIGGVLWLLGALNVGPPALG